MMVLGRIVCVQWATTNGTKQFNLSNMLRQVFILELLYSMSWKKRKYRPWLITEE